jgi:hypothetical protein
MTSATPAIARTTIDASEPDKLAVTLYRDPHREVGETMDRNWPQGFAMISETRRVTLPPGESTIRFDGVAEGKRQRPSRRALSLRLRSLLRTNGV